MTVARDKPAWAQRVDPISSFLSGLSRIFAGTKPTRTTKGILEKLALTVDLTVRKQTFM
jgi:hypothetical protein